MRTMTTMALMLAVGVAGAQQATPPPGRAESKTVKTEVPAPKKSALEEALDLALKHNPDLRVAASKLALAEAELSKARLQVTQKVAAAYADVEVARATLKEIERQAARFGELRRKGAISAEEGSKIELQLVEAKAKLAAAERELTHLQGKGSRTEQYGATLGMIHLRTVADGKMFDFDVQGKPDIFIAGSDNIRVWTYPNLLEGTTPKTDGSDKLRQALQKPVTLSGQKMPLSEYLDLVKKTGGFGIQADLKDVAWKETVDFDFKDVTVGGMLQFLEDSLPNHRIVVRHYGLLIATREKVPEGALTLTAFLNAEPAKPAAEKKPAVLPGTNLKR